MSAFTKNNPSILTAGSPVQHQHWFPTVQQNNLPDFQLQFLNREACREVSPFNKHFWPELINLLSDKSQQVMELPKAACYRSSLEPYRHLRVHITAESWAQIEDKERRPGDPIHLMLYNPRVTHVHNRPGTAVMMPSNAAVHHMHIWVSVKWMSDVSPNPVEPLVLEGVLYEYASSHQVRNIGVLPVLLTDKSRKLDLYRDPNPNPPQPTPQPAGPDPVVF